MHQYGERESTKSLESTTMKISQQQQQHSHMDSDKIQTQIVHKLHNRTRLKIKKKH